MIELSCNALLDIAWSACDALILCARSFYPPLVPLLPCPCPCPSLWLSCRIFTNIPLVETLLLIPLPTTLNGAY